MAICTYTDVKAALRITDTTDDSLLTLATSAAIEMVQDYCGRQFAADTSATARVFYPDEYDCVEVDDISTTTGLIVKTGIAGTFSTTWSATDYELLPLNGRYRGRAWPYTTIRAVRSLTFFDDVQASVEVTAKWGWPAVPDAVKAATIMQAVALFKGPESPFGAMGMVDVGVIRARGMSDQVKALLTEFRRDAVTL